MKILAYFEYSWLLLKGCDRLMIWLAIINASSKICNHRYSHYLSSWRVSRNCFRNGTHTDGIALRYSGLWGKMGHEQLFSQSP
jgi:hypothetical protein